MVTYPPRGRDKKKRNLTPIYKYHLLHNKDFLDLGDISKNEFKKTIELMPSVRKGDYTKLTKQLSVMIIQPQNKEIRRARAKKEWDEISKIMERVGGV